MNIRKWFTIIFSIAVLSVSTYYSLNSQYYTFREETDHIIPDISNSLLKNTYNPIGDVEDSCSKDTNIMVAENELVNELANGPVDSDEIHIASVAEGNHKSEDYKDLVIDEIGENDMDKETRNQLDSEFLEKNIADEEKEEYSIYFSENRPVIYDTQNQQEAAEIFQTDDKKENKEIKEAVAVKTSRKVSSSVSAARTEEEIVDEYNVKFSNLRKEFNSSIDGLVEEAKQEYYDIDHSKRGQLVKYLSEKYLSSAIELEKNSNERFYNLLTDMEDELMENNCSLKYIKVVEDTFVKEKRAKKNELMSKAVQILQ